MKQSLFFYALLILALFALAAMVWLLAPGAAPETPPVELLTPSEPGRATVSTDVMPPELSVLDISVETVQTVITNLVPVETYSRTLTAELFWDGGSSVRTIDVWASGDRLRLTVTQDGAEQYVLLQGDQEWIWYPDGAVWSGAVQSADADRWQTLVTYQDVLKLDVEDILDAGYADYNGEFCIFVRYRSGYLGYENICYISDQTGLLMGSETYDDDVLIYALHSSAPELGAPDEAIFLPPIT